MEVWKISQLFKILLFIILNFESVFSTAHEELLNLIDCLIRGLDVSRPGEVDENYSSLQVCKIEKSFLALQALQFLRHCTTLWRVCVCMRVLNLVFYLILLFLLRVWISNSSWLIWYGEATVIYININSKMPCIPIIWSWHATPSAITHWKKKKNHWPWCLHAPVQSTFFPDYCPCGNFIWILKMSRKVKLAFSVE